MRIGITQEGMFEGTMDGFVDHWPSTTRELVAMWKDKLEKLGERKMLDILVKEYPAGLSREKLGEASGYTASGGTFANYLGTLRRNRLISINNHSIQASDTLFPEKLLVRGG